MFHDNPNTKVIIVRSFDAMRILWNIRVQQMLERLGREFVPITAPRFVLSSSSELGRYFMKEMYCIGDNCMSRHDLEAPK